jgi:hypothetical protein
MSEGAGVVPPRNNNNGKSMSEEIQIRQGGIAETSNMDLVATAIERLMNRSDGLPGMAALYGRAGHGKTYAALRMANRYRGYYIQMRSCWGRGFFLKKLLQDHMGIKPLKTIPEMLDQVAAQLAASQRPLIIDEFDYCAASSTMAELVRDIHEASGAAPILCIGEDDLPQVLLKRERLHSRFISWVPALPVSLGDAQKLRPLYAAEIEIAEDLLKHLVEVAHGSVRRVCVNLELIQEVALVEGWGSVDLATWGQREVYTGEAPRPTQKKGAGRVA